ncbi:MAG: hypothetical protein IT470_04465 [Pseudomonadales bacterium]|nr:hypothetical protein [Pseudomonadales bacterium]
MPEQMFSTPDNPAHGVSAVKAIQLAAQQGQKIFTITQANVETVLAAINLSADIKDEIRNAAYAGKEITTHERYVSYFGGTTAGYLILDPRTGAGAYMLDSGEDGGVLKGSEYLVKTVGYYLDALVSLASHYKTPLPPVFENVVRFLQIAKLTIDLLQKGTKCKNFEALAIFLAITTILSILMVELTIMIANPIAAFAVGVGMDLALDWFVAQSPDCMKD